MRRLVALASACALALTAVDAADALPGAVDRGFGSGGAVPPAFGLGARAAAVAQAPDGRLVVAGDVRDAAGESLLVARYTAAGELDPSFAGSGGRRDRFGATGESPQRAGAVAVQADGAVLVAGVAGDALALARYLPDGALDGLFGAGGVALSRPVRAGGPPDGSGPAAIALGRGQIVVAGGAGVASEDPYEDGPDGEQIVVGRYDEHGRPDASFGRDGFALLQLGARSPRRPAASSARGLVLRADGSIVIAGRATDTSGAERAFVARLTATGRLDTGFARGGRLLAQLGTRSAARPAGSALAAIAERADGTLLAAGSATDAAGRDAVALVRLTPEGALDARFGRGGVVHSQLGRARAAAAPGSFARSLVLTSDGAALIAGSASGGGALVARYGAAQGRLDCGFGDGGGAIAFGGAAAFDPAVDGAAALLVQPGVGLVLAGRRAGGGLLLGRLLGGAGARPPAAPAARPVTLAARYGGRGRGHAYGLVDGGCRTAFVRFTITSGRGRAIRTRVQRVPGAFGPQVVCAPLTGLRPGGRYRVRLEVVGGVRPRGAWRVLRAGARPAGKPPAQDGCR